MGASICCGGAEPLGGPAPVTLQIYDVSGNVAIRSVNRLFRAMGTGAFHAAVEVYGKEWSFGYIEQGTGIFCCRPKGCTAHRYREAVSMGLTEFGREEVEELLESMSVEWPGVDYDLLHQNCCHFSNELCKVLGVGPIPRWVMNLAGAGATVSDGVKTAASKAQAAAIIAKAKAGSIDERYRIRGRVQAKASDLVSKAGRGAGAAKNAAGGAAKKAGAVAGAVGRSASAAVSAGKDASGKALAKVRGRSDSNVVNNAESARFVADK